MKKIFMGCVAAATAMTLSTSILADDSKPFSGPYVGIEGGFGSLKNSSVKDNNRWSIGAVAGYRHQFDNDLVLGFEGAINSTSDIKSSNLGSLFDTDYKPTWSASALLGYAFGEDKKNLLFVKGGYMRLRHDLTISPAVDTSASTTTTGGVTKFRQGAFKLGAGYERKLTNTFSVRVGADYVKYKDIHKQLEGKVALIVNF